MIDFHCHVLPDLDDGSRNLIETECLLREELRQQINTLIVTPHFYANASSVSSFLEKRTERYTQVQQLIRERDLAITLRAGAEVSYFPMIGTAEQLHKLCIEGTNLILLELPVIQWSETVYTDLERIIEKQKLTVILAHIERYYKYQKKKEIWEKVFALPVIPQINAGSFVPDSAFSYKRRRFCINFLKNHPVLLGSDCHNMICRKPNLIHGREAISKKLGSDYLKQVDEFAERIITTHATEPKA